MKQGITGLALLVLAVPLWAADPKPPEGKSFQVPFRLSDTHHILVRAKINGKGPYTFLVDTGAPALFVSTAIGKKHGIDADKEGWGMVEKLELEGGLVLDKAKARVADPYQLTGMNSMGLAGTELHGVLGYNVLARYRIHIDLNKDKMTWTRLNFEPPAPEPLENKPGAEEPDAMGALVQMIAKMLGKGNRELSPRGFLGIELAEKAATIQAVLPKSPAAAAGLQAGDRIVRFRGEKVTTPADLYKLAGKVIPGDTVKLTVERGGKTQDIDVEAGKGL